MRILIKLLTALSALLIGTMASGQDDATLTVFGEGATKDEATANALRSAIEQAYGVFVSADTKILNDELVKDEIATISTGNIKSYKELSQVKTPDGRYNVSLSAVVSIQNLTKYSQSHGSSAEFAGQTFTYNIRMRVLNKKNEMIALRNMIDQLRCMQDDIFDYNIVEVKEPQFVSDSIYSVSVKIDVITNPNYENFLKIISNTLESLSLTWDEIKNYNSNKTSVQFFIPYYSEFWVRKRPIDAPTVGNAMIKKNATISDFSPNLGYFYLRSNLRDLNEIAEQICSIYNKAQYSFYIRSEDNSNKEWSPSEYEVNTITTQKYESEIDLPNSSLEIDSMLYLAPVGKSVWMTYFDPDMNCTMRKEIFRDIKLYSSTIPYTYKNTTYDPTTYKVNRSIPPDSGKSVVTITHTFQYDLETLSSLKGFNIVKKSID